MNNKVNKLAEILAGKESKKNLGELINDFFSQVEVSYKEGSKNNPVKGKDYFTDEEVEKFKKDSTPVKGKDYFDGYTPVKGVDYKDGEDGYSPVKGVDYNDGKDGHTPIKGVDYFTPKDIADFKKSVIPVKGKDYFDGSPDTAEMIAEKLNKKKEVLKFETVIGYKDLLKNIDKKFSDFSNTVYTKGQIDQRWHGGGLSRVFTDATITGSGIPGDPLSVVGSSTAWGLITGTITDQTDLVEYIASLGYLTDSPSDGKTYGRKNGAWSEVAGGGDVIAPATNTDSYIPQWDGANSKTLKNGLAVPAGGLAGITALNAKQDALGFTPENVSNKKTSLVDNSDTYYPSQKAVKTAVDAKQDSLGFTPENVSNKATSFATVNDTLYPTVKAVNDAITSAVVGLLDYRGSYDASTNLFPATGGSGLAGAVLKGDFWIISVAGTLGGNAVYVGDMVIALQDTPGQTASNWNIVEYGISYVPENSANKETSALDTSTTKYPCNNVVKTAVDLKLDASQKAAASGVASLDGSSKVVQDPANATATATASKIVIADGSGKIDTWVSDSSDTVKGKVELATSAETTTGTDATRAVTPDGLSGSTIFGAKTVQIQIVASGTDVDTTSGIGYFNAPQCINGMNLIRAQAYVDTAGTTNATTIQVRNMTKYSSNDALSSAISIASGGTVGTAGTVNTSYDDVATDDLIKIYVTGQSTTKPKGLRVCLEYQLP